jgi:uncharacterized protein
MRAEDAVQRSTTRRGIAIVIDDMGLDDSRSQKVLALPGPLTLSFLTYVNDLDSWAARARAAGHEVLAHVPMEPLDAPDSAGPGCLRVTMSPDVVRSQLAASLDGWSGYVGVNNHMGSRFCQDRRLMNAVMEELKSRDLFWLDSRTTAASEGLVAATAAGVPCLERDVFLDHVDREDAVFVQLDQLERIGRKKGAAIAIGHPRENTIRALEVWLARLPQTGLTLVPITALLG